MAIGILTITRERDAVIDFLGPIITSGLSTMISIPPPTSKLFQMYEPFEITTWLLTFTCIVFTGIVIYLLNHYSPFSAWNLRLPGADSDEVSFVENMWFTMRSMLRQREFTLDIDQFELTVNLHCQYVFFFGFNKMNLCVFEKYLSCLFR